MWSLLSFELQHTSKKRHYAYAADFEIFATPIARLQLPSKEHFHTFAMIFGRKS
jgi:hypothetical protein